MDNKFYVTWENLHQATRNLAQRLLPASRWDGILAVSRGGLVPATILARELEIRYVDTICAVSYYEQTQSQIELIKKPQSLPENLLIVDDLVDSGETAKHIRQLYPNAFYAVVYAKPLGMACADVFEQEISQDTWVEFPWDIALQAVPPIARSSVQDVSSI